MRLRIDIEIPQWTKWIAGGIAIGVVLGVGASRVYAGTVAVPNTFAPDTVLTADALNANFKALQDAVNSIQDSVSQMQNPDCPAGYTRDAGATTIVLCKKGLDEVVKVGTGSSAYWIDRYEASVFDNVNATGTQYGLASAAEYASFLLESGECAGRDTNGNCSTPLYAFSVPLPVGSKPSAYVTWFQAQMACRFSGKRLPTGEEWLAASHGTPDPVGGEAGTSGLCVTGANGARHPGAGPSCASTWGAQDMIGNLFEWTTEWYAAPGTASAAPNSTWTRGAFNSDGNWNIASVAYDGDAYQTGLPAAPRRGGRFDLGVNSGRFSLNLSAAPSFGSSSEGFRCVIPR